MSISREAHLKINYVKLQSWPSSKANQQTPCYILSHFSTERYNQSEQCALSKSVTLFSRQHLKWWTQIIFDCLLFENHLTYKLILVSNYMVFVEDFKQLIIFNY